MTANREEKHSALWYLGVMVLIGGVALMGILAVQAWMFWSMRLGGTEVTAVVADVSTVRTSPVQTLRGGSLRTRSGTENILSVVIPDEPVVATGDATASDAAGDDPGMDAFFAGLKATTDAMNDVPAGQELVRRACPDAVVEGMYPGRRVQVLWRPGTSDFFLVGHELTRSFPEWLVTDNVVITLIFLAGGIILVALGRKQHGR